MSRLRLVAVTLLAARCGAAGLATEVTGSAAMRGAGAAGDGEPELAYAEAAVAQASAAAKAAWAAEAKVKQLAAANSKYAPMVEAEIETAKNAAKAAAKADKQAGKLLEDTRAKAKAAALQSAQGYFAKVKAASAAAVKQAFAVKEMGDEHLKAAATKAAAEAARPYNAAMLRGQRVLADYVKHYQAMSAAGSHLQAEAMTLASSAEQYQMMGQAPQANQIMMTAHTLLSQGDAMRHEAEALRDSVKELQASLPLYQQAEQAAVANAAQEASVSGPTLPPIELY